MQNADNQSLTTPPTKGGNGSLHKAKRQKNDEFYTQYPYIEREVNAYLEYNPDTFRDKIVLLPCDDPEWSNFTKYFAEKFEELGLKKLISTSYAPESKNYPCNTEPTEWEKNSPLFDWAKSKTRGKIFVLERDTSGDGRISHDDIEWRYLEGNGDFNSAEVRKLRDEADIIVTNPPFSLFREFLAWLTEHPKDFLIIGNHNAITYKEVFPRIMENKMWLGATCNGQDMVFGVPEGAEVAPKDKQKAEKLGYKGNYTRLGNSCWYSNMEHGRRHTPMTLLSTHDVFKFAKIKELKGRTSFAHYDNYDAIEIPRINAIPSDYDGVMGVPITFLEHYCPEQFEILGATQRGCHDKVPDTKKYDEYLEMKPDGTPTGSKGGKTNENANLEMNDGKKNYFIHPQTGHVVQSAYQRIFIKRITN